MSLEERRRWIDPSDAMLSLSAQCVLLQLARSSWYYEPVAVSAEDQRLMELIDEQYTKTPFYGSRKMALFLRSLEYEINRKHVQRLMRTMGIEGLCPGPNTSRRRMDHVVYPYLLRGMVIDRPNQVWGIDITYLRLLRGFAYLVAILDWYSRYVIAWRISNSLETTFCVEALEEALEHTSPEILNSDQGCQFTSQPFTRPLLMRNIRISMDSRGRAFDNIFVERLWRTVKYEEVYLKGYHTMSEAHAGLTNYFHFYNHERFHQALAYRTPWDIYRAASPERRLSFQLPGQKTET